MEKEILLTFSLSSSSSTGSSLGRSSTMCRILGDSFLKLGHLEPRCPGSRQQKQTPFSMHFLCSSEESLLTFMTSTFMVSGSQTLVGVEKDW